MTWMSNLVARFLGTRSLNVHVESVVSHVEPVVWQKIDGRVSMRSAQEVQGYVWAAAAPAVRTAVFELAPGLNDREMQSVVDQARNLIATRVASQLEMYSDDQTALRRAA